MKGKNKIILGIGVAIICVVIVFSIGISGGSAKTVMSIGSNTKSSMKMIYKSFDGEKYRILNLNSGDTLDVNIDVTTKSGDLNVFILDNNNNEIYNVKNPDKVITKSIDIKEDGKYTIKVEGKHSGSYKINWDIN